MRITVKYWIGTTQLEATARTYKGALRIAAKNQNAFPARYFDPQGKELHDTGFGLAYAEPSPEGRIVCAV